MILRHSLSRKILQKREVQFLHNTNPEHNMKLAEIDNIKFDVLNILRCVPIVQQYF